MQNRGDEVSKALASAGAGLGDQVLVTSQCRRDFPGHRQLLGTRFIVRKTSRNQPVGIKNGVDREFFAIQPGLLAVIGSKRWHDTSLTKNLLRRIRRDEMG